MDVSPDPMDCSPDPTHITPATNRTAAPETASRQTPQPPSHTPPPSAEGYVQRLRAHVTPGGTAPAPATGSGQATPQSDQPSEDAEPSRAHPSPCRGAPTSREVVVGCEPGLLARHGGQQHAAGGTAPDLLASAGQATPIISETAAAAVSQHQHVAGGTEPDLSTSAGQATPISETAVSTVTQHQHAARSAAPHRNASTISETARSATPAGQSRARKSKLIAARSTASVKLRSRDAVDTFDWIFFRFIVFAADFGARAKVRQPQQVHSRGQTAAVAMAAVRVTQHQSTEHSQPTPSTFDRAATEQLCQVQRIGAHLFTSVILLQLSAVQPSSSSA